MRSDSKVPLPADQVAALTRALIGSEPEAVTELTEGMYNAAYRVTVPGRGDLVLKVAPPDDVPSLRYESSLMATEVGFYERAQGLAPVPDVVASDFSRRLVDRDVMFMSALDGRSLRSAARRLSKVGRRAVRADLGAIVGRLHGVTGERFGYERAGGELSAATWREAFGSMTAAVLDDIPEHRVPIGGDPGEARMILHAASSALAAVETPVLVHFDLWDGNVFVAPQGGVERVSGIIDGERAFWGDPLADLVSTSLFRDPAADRDFLRGYAGASGTPLRFGDAARTRLAL